MTTEAEDAIRFAEVSIDGLPLKVAHQDLWIWREAAEGRWEPETLGVVKRLTQNGDLVIDVGAYYGLVTAVGAGCGAFVHAFEPDPVARAALERTLSLNPELAARVSVHPEAVGGSERRARLSSERLGNSGASLVRDQPEATDVRVRDAATLADCGLDACSLLKIDVEGAEYEILPRLLSQLEQFRPSLLLSVHTYQLREPFQDWPQPLRGLAYRLRSLPKQGRIILAARRLGPTYISEPNSGRWRRLRGRRLISTLMRVGEKELLVLGRRDA